MSYTLTKAEREVIIRFDDETGNATIYTTNPNWIRKMDRITAENPEEFQVTEEWKVDGELVSRTYQFPKDLLTIRTKRRKLNLTEEQRAAASERARRILNTESRNTYSKSVANG